MPVTIAPSATPDYPVDITLPSTGDSMTTAAGAGPIDPPIVKVLNGTEAARLQLLGNGCRRRVVSTDGTTFTIYPLGSVGVVVGGVTKVLPHTASSPFNITTGGAPAANTRYFIYASIVAGVITFSKSTTPPDDAIHFKTGDQAYLYISTCVTDAATGVVPYQQSDSLYTYLSYVADGAGVSGNIVLDRGVATAYTGVVTVNAVPVLASMWIAQINFASTNNGDAGQVSFVNPATVGNGWSGQYFGAGGRVQGQCSGPNHDGLIFYKVQSATFDTLTIWCSSFVM